jgi:hypothetical protein
LRTVNEENISLECYPPIFGLRILSRKKMLRSYNLQKMFQDPVC